VGSFFSRGMSFSYSNVLCFRDFGKNSCSLYENFFVTGGKLPRMIIRRACHTSEIPFVS
jgi:hypothetical protein